MEKILFREKLKELHKKSGMDVFLEWPFVYDRDEMGKIFIDENGIFFFSDNCYNWVNSHLNLENVVNLRYAIFHEEGGIDNVSNDNISGSYIFINFSTGEQIELFNKYDTATVIVSVKVCKNEKNCVLIEQLQALSNNEMRFSIK